MAEVKAMVAQDPLMLDRFSNAENKQMVEDVLAKRRKKTRGRVPTISRRRRTRSGQWTA
jgi:hypothetical protein